MKKSFDDGEKSGRDLLSRPIQWLFGLDEIVHMLVALILVAIALSIMVDTVMSFKSFDIHSLLKTVNMVLLVLIVMEILWPVLAVLKKEPFTLNPFIYVCIISSIRRILIVEAEMSIGSYDHHAYAMEMGISVGTILVMIIVHYIYNRGYIMEKRCGLPPDDEKQE